jgi:tRNA1Val (adenine37-N6)-methyltransferase
MKISTDSLLLGAWAIVSESCSVVLDIGAGNGIISLMLAQRISDCKIEAIEMDKESFDECVENFANSRWKNRMTCFHAAWQDFVKYDFKSKYDLIVSNPPYYSENLPKNHSSKHLAKFSSSLPFDELIDGVYQLLSENGVFCVIIPFKEKIKFINKAESKNLFPLKITDVKGNKNTQFKRSLIAFIKKKSDCKNDELIIEIERNRYTDEYKNLTKDFYLNF